jgi:radical SAM protein with 4Fe4S-binding SPASM domain
MDIFDFTHHLYHRLALAHDVAAPIYAEIHPGLHCDLYKCPHCYGYGQKVLSGQVLTVGEIDTALAEIETTQPTINISGVTTEPLTHPDAAGIIRVVRRRKLPLGLYTKGRRLDSCVRRALVEGNGEAFVTVSLDAVTPEEYCARHGILPNSREGSEATRGRDYFDLVLDNMRLLKKERDSSGSSLKIRGAFLLFTSNSFFELVEKALDRFGPHVDLLRFAFPQIRNDGERPGTLPRDRSEILSALAKHFADEPKVKILTTHANPERARGFRICNAQRFQLVIDKTGNVFPCPETAVQAYEHLSYGNIRSRRLIEILQSSARRDMFDRDIDSDMRCRVCNRRDESINVALAELSAAFGAHPFS